MMTRTNVTRYLLGLSLAAAGCGPRTPAPATRGDAAASAPVAAPVRVAQAAANTPTHIDSVVPRAVALARFQGASSRAAALTGGAPSRDELVRRFARAVEAGDTASLRRMVLSRGEFAFLYYPTSRQGMPPYDLSPDLLWFMMVEQSNRGATALIQERSGGSLGYAGYRCLGDSTVEGRNTLWGPCLVRRKQAVGDTVEERLFGPIVERDGRFKFVSYSNKL
jgi:hypothetical protein